MNAKEVAATIRKALKERSGKAWTVTYGRGTDVGYLTIISPRSRCVFENECDRKRGYFRGNMTETEQIELAMLLGLPPRLVNFQGKVIPPFDDYYQEYIDRAQGKEPVVYGCPF